MHRLLFLPWLVACSGAMPGPGRPGSLDVDGDGWASGDGDCDDGDPESFPLALDAPSDGVDQDCDGVDAESLDARALRAGDLVITEVMPDPLVVGADEGEWFEVTSELEVPVDLRGLWVHDEDGDDFEIDRPLVVGARGRVVLGVSDDRERNGGVAVDLGYDAGFGLSNDEDVIVLEIGGEVVDRVAWGADWPLEDGTALSLHRGLGALANDDPTGWCPAVHVYGIAGRGTPGMENPTCPAPFTGKTALDLEEGDLVLTEVMQNPAAVDDEVGEWLEVLNTTDDDVDLRGVTLSDGADTTLELPSAIVAAGGRIVLGSFVDPELNGGVPVDLEWRWEFGLENSGQVVALSVGTLLLDRVSYDDGITFPDPAGASMSLEPTAEEADENDDGDRWCAGTTPMPGGDLGTPGEANPLCP